MPHTTPYKRSDERPINPTCGHTSAGCPYILIARSTCARDGACPCGSSSAPAHPVLPLRCCMPGHRTGGARVVLTVSAFPHGYGTEQDTPPADERRPSTLIPYNSCVIRHTSPPRPAGSPSRYSFLSSFSFLRGHAIRRTLGAPLATRTPLGPPACRHPLTCCPSVGRAPRCCTESREPCP